MLLCGVTKPCTKIAMWTVSGPSRSVASCDPHLDKAKKWAAVYLGSASQAGLTVKRLRQKLPDTIHDRPFEQPKLF